MPGLRGMELADIRNEGPWRSDSFMHQLSMNGSLLLLRNHDQIWDDSYWFDNPAPVRGWSTERLALLNMPAGQARRRLWQTSHGWWAAMSAYREELGRFMLLRGLGEDERLRRLDEDLIRIAGQLEELSWCRVDDDRGQIEVVRI